MKRDRLIRNLKIARRWCVSLLVLLWGVSPGVVAQKQPAERTLIEPFVMREDFQGDSLGQWASYPPVQDIGYEPSLSPTAEYDAPGGRALMRVVRPVRVGPLRFGFIKRLRLLMSGDARLSFAYRLGTPSPNDQLEIGLAGRDGRRYTIRVPVSAKEEDRWARVDLALADARDESGRAIGAGLRVEALYLVANLARADPDETCRFIIDDVALGAARDSNWDVRLPEAIRIEPWRALTSAVGYHPGDTINIKAVAPARLARAECILKTSDEKVIATAPLYDDGTHGDERAGDRMWTNNSLFVLRASDPVGVWMAQLRGTSAEGLSLDTDVRFIVHPPGPHTHPRLLFGASDRERLVARSGDPKFAALWSKLRAAARDSRETGELSDGGEIFSRLDRGYLLPSLLGYFDVLSRARVRISSNAFDAYLTGDPQSLAAAKAAILDVARWKTWAPPWFEAHGQHTYYPAGELAFDVAFAYDLLYDNLSESERALVRRALIENSIVPTYREYVLDNRAMADTSNWIAHTVGGALLAAASITGDGPATESGGRLELYLNGLLQKLESHLGASYLPDGSYGEGISYQEFDLESLGPALTALERVYGMDYWKQSAVAGSLAYPLYTLARPTGASLDMGDSHPPSGRTIAPLVFRSKDPLLYWYYNQFEHSTMIDFIFFDDSVAPRPPALPTSRLFMDKGNAVFRTGWGPEDMVFLYRAGPTFNHNHNDQGSFLLTAFGENLISEGGWSDYYKDPYYETYFTQAAGHNTVLVDGNPQSQLTADTRQFSALDSFPRITDAVTSEFHDALTSELSSVYAGRLERFTRRIVFVKPHYFVIYDDLATNGATARFDWLLHLPDRARVRQSPPLAVYTGERAALAVRNLAPTDAELRVRDGRIPYHVFATRTPPSVPAEPAILDWRSASPAASAQLLFALVPARKAEEAETLAGRMVRLAGERAIGLSAERGTERDLIIFRTGGAGGEVRQGEWSVDADAWRATLEGERLKILAAQSARTVARAGRTLFASEAPVSFAANYTPSADLNASEIEVVCDAQRAAKITLLAGKAPVRVLLDGGALSAGAFSFNRADQTVSLSIPAGQHGLRIMFR